MLDCVDKYIHTHTHTFIQTESRYAVQVSRVVFSFHDDTADVDLGVPSVEQDPQERAWYRRWGEVIEFWCEGERGWGGGYVVKSARTLLSLSLFFLSLLLCLQAQ